ncbi:MAG: ABC transporter permease [Dehalococcoidia bacterium]|nr:ABC transporter permease [Dehalococcoidia bacterium]
MTTQTTRAAELPDLPVAFSSTEERGWFAVFWDRFRKKRLGLIGLGVVLVIYAAGLFAPFIAPYSYRDQDLDRSVEGPSADHWLGTDRIGRDIFTRILYSSRTNLVITAAVVLSGSILIGNTLGLLTGYVGGRLDGAIMRVGDVFASLPGLLMLIVVNASLSPRVIEGVRAFEANVVDLGMVSSGFASYITVFAALSLFSWVGTARLIRAQVLQLRERDYIMAAQAIGAPTGRIMFQHLLPNVAHLIILQVSTGLGAIAGSEIFLSWFGVGVQPPAPSFGQLIQDGGGARTLRESPHLLLAPGAVVTSLMFGFALLGDAVTDAFRGR